MAGKSRSIDDQVLDIIIKNESIRDDLLASTLPNITPEQRAQAINNLLGSHRIQIVGELDHPIYRALAQEEAIKMKGLSAEDVLVYQVISQAGDTGIWTKDMKLRTNIAQGKIQKTLKILEERGLVKSVKSVQNASRKVYMLANLEPAKEITGGPWYGNDQLPDQEFINAIRSVVVSYVEKHGGYVSVEEVADAIAKTRVSNQELQVEDVENIIKTLEYDSILNRVAVGIEEVSKYCLCKQRPPETTSFTDFPCGVCPVFNDCNEGGPVSPEKCEYFKTWLNELKF